MATIAISNVLQLPEALRAAAALRTSDDPLLPGYQGITLFDEDGVVRSVFWGDVLKMEIGVGFPGDPNMYLLVSPSAAPYVPPTDPPDPPDPSDLDAARADMAAARTAYEAALKVAIESENPTDITAANTAAAHLSRCETLVALLEADEAAG
jgi:hypothetical protein